MGFLTKTWFSLVLRILSLISAIGGIVAVSGVNYPAQEFYYYFFLSVCGLWSLVNIGLLCLIRFPHPGYRILFDFISLAASVFLVTVSWVGAVFNGHGLKGRAFAALVLAGVAMVVHFVMFILACRDLTGKRSS